MTKIKEIKDDAIIKIEVNKAFYLMIKALSLYLFTSITNEDKDGYLKDLVSKEYKNLDELQKNIYTVILLLAEIEKQGTAQNMYIEKEVEEPPKID
jgi:hypothetical protein